MKITEGFFYSTTYLGTIVTAVTVVTVVIVVIVLTVLTENHQRDLHSFKDIL